MSNFNIVIVANVDTSCLAKPNGDGTNQVSYTLTGKRNGTWIVPAGLDISGVLDSLCIRSGYMSEEDE